MSDTIAQALKQLLGYSPVLLTYLIGLVLALVFWRRCPVSCFLTLMASLLLMLTTVAHPFVFQYLIRAREEMGWSLERREWLLFAFGMAYTLVHALGIGLLLAAVFLGRKVEQRLGPGKYQ